MAKRSARRSSSDSKPKMPHFESLDPGDHGLEGQDRGGAERTGRMIVTTVDTGKSAMDAALKKMSDITGLSSSASHVVRAAEDTADNMMQANYGILGELNIAVVNGGPEVMNQLSTLNVQEHGVVVEPEYWNFPLGRESGVTSLDEGFADRIIERTDGSSVVSRDFLLGCRSMIDQLLNLSAAAGGSIVQDHTSQCFEDNNDRTWGLQATRAANSALTGRGTRVAVLDTGFDAGHPDFAGRDITRATFIPSGEPDNTPDDTNGHGTHCIGTSCGSRMPGTGSRYGIASEASIFAGKVLRQGPEGGAGADAWILEGINWALQNRCHIISMSLGSRATSARFPMMYEMAARRGLEQGTLFVAAAGNDSGRSFGQIAAVGRPANCPSIAAVAAIDHCFHVADFSNGQQFESGGEINLTGPGVDVISSVPVPRLRASFSGTSMATPHVAGIAALVHQQTGFTGLALYRELRRRAQFLGMRRDFGNGLVRV